MIFLDTNIWIELVVARTPVTEHEKNQAKKSGELLQAIWQKGEVVVTCKEQLLEIINAVEKVKKKRSKQKKKREQFRGNRRS